MMRAAGQKFSPWKALRWTVALAFGAMLFAPAGARADGIHTCGNDSTPGSFCYYETTPGKVTYGVSKRGTCKKDSARNGNTKYCSNTLTKGPRKIGVCPVPLSQSNYYCEVNR